MPLCFQYLVYPMIDDRERDRIDARDHDDEGMEPELEPDRMEVVPGRSGRRRRRAALRRTGTRATVDDLRGLPPTYIDVGELDPFRDEDIAYASRLLAAGVPCELHVTPGAFHGSEMAVPDTPSSRRIRAYRRDALSRVLA